MTNEKIVLSHFKKRDPKIYAYMKTVDFNDWFNYHKKLKGKNDYFVSLCRNITGQQLSGKAARAIWTKFEKLFGRKRVLPKNVLSLTDQQIRDVGMSWAKVKYIKDLAHKVLEGEIHLENLRYMSDKDVIDELTRVKGIGVWTAEMFLIFTLKREDIFSYGDLGLRKGVEKVYDIEDPTEDKIEKIVKKWSPYKSYGSIALWHSLDS
jgi:DNA-3-methyladenine glycosylase II